MPTVVSSQATLYGYTEKDQSFFVRETHTLSDGSFLYFDITHAPGGCDYHAIMQSRAIAYNLTVASQSLGL